MEQPDEVIKVYESLIVDNYRSFPHFELHGLGRVNLLVGKNNSGKTSLLEAIQVLATRADLKALWTMSNRRGETFTDDNNRRSEMDISHWFFGSNPHSGSNYKIVATNGGLTESCEISIVARQDSVAESLLPPSPPLALDNASNSTPEELIDWFFFQLQILSNGNEPQRFRLTERGGFIPRSGIRPPGAENEPRVVFVPTSGLGANELVKMIEDISLTDMETLVLKTMQNLDPRIERFVAIGGELRPRIMVRLTGFGKPMPIGILGDGVSRLMTIAVALAKSANGVLLIDEIDTGLHHIAMDRMWKFVNDSAEMLNVQVFATTHSRDCFESLAVICQETSEAPNRVSIQRIDRDRDRAVGYSEAEIVAVARRGLEVR